MRLRMGVIGLILQCFGAISRLAIPLATKAAAVRADAAIREREWRIDVLLAVHALRAEVEFFEWAWHGYIPNARSNILLK